MDGNARLARVPIVNRLTNFQQAYRVTIARKSTLLVFRILPKFSVLTELVNSYRSGRVYLAAAQKKPATAR